MKTIKNKRKKLLVFSLVLTIILLSSFNFNVIKGISDDNYSTYLYNQNINVAKDKAHLLSEQSDGSNSYRNIFQSNFLFPAKLQSNMLSTSATSVFSHYSFNQFYFDNLNNDYAYNSNDNNENFIESIVPNDFEVEKGSNIANGSLENQDSSFGKYNSTYTFDDYQETESNYGYYYMSEYNDFNNETIGNINLDIKWIDVLIENPNAIIVNDVFNHKNVLQHQKGYILHQLSYINSETFEFYTNVPDNTKNTGIMFSEGLTNCLILKPCYYDGKFEYNNGTHYIEVQSVSNNEWYHHKVVIKPDNTFDWYINSILKIDNEKLTNNMTNGINRVMLWSQALTHIVYVDAFGIVNSDDSYNTNDNTNPYGLQSELEQDINYNYGLEYSINNINNYHNNVLNFTDYSNSKRNTMYDSFSNQPYGIIEFSLNCNNTQLYSDYYAISTNYIFGIRINNYKFGYYDGSWNDLSFNINNNQWYNIKIYFESSNSGFKNLSQYTFSLYIDNVFYITSNFAVNQENLKTLRFCTSTTNYNYYILIDNIDYSWSNRYYENRINDVIPLNDSNYNMYKNEIRTNSKSVIILPNQDIQTEWSEGTASGNPHYTYIDDYPNHDSTSTYLFTSGYGYHHDIIGFQTDVNRTYNKIEVKIVSYLYGSTSKRLEIAISDKSDFSNTYDYYPILGTSFYFSQLDTITFNQTINNINDLEISFQKMDNAGYQFFITQIYLVCYYDDLELSIITEKEIDYNSNGKPVLNTLYYSMCGNLDYYFSLYIYNYDINSYYKIKNYSNNKIFNIYSFEFNESAYFRFNKFKLKIFSNNSFDYNFFIDLLVLNITYIKENNNGYHEIIAYNQRYDDSDTYKGYSRFELQIHNNSLKYRYSEINEYTDNYVYSWCVIDVSNITIDNIELQSHVRYGLNTLDIEIINFYYIIYINYDDDLTIEFMEQSRKELDCHKIKSSFNYTSYTRNYLNQTGIIGNYSYNVFKGCRSLYGLTSEVFHRYFNIPYFSNDIEINIPFVVPDDSVSNPAEPTPPSDYYWTYETFKTVFYRDIDMNIGNWSVKFKQMKSEIYEAKHFYYPKSVNKDDFPSFKWTFKFSDSFSYTINFNFLRNAGISILNLILLFAQWIGFMILASLSYLFMYIGTTILVFIWNTLIYSVFYVLLTIFWYIYAGIYVLLDAIWIGLVWVYENLLIPFFEWFWYEGIPWIIDFMIIILAHIITLLIYLITLGGIDYEVVYANVYIMLREIADEIIGMTLTFLRHFDYIILFILYYLLLCGLMYLRYIYCKARGFNNRAEQLKSSFDVFVLPIVLILDFINNIRDIKQTINPFG